METPDQDNDSLRSLEERIHQAVQLVTRLRQEKEALAAEVEALRAERKQVRSRIEKLLGQVDQLSGA